jgi:hypothetical protein
MYTGTKSGNPPPPLIRIEKEDYHIAFVESIKGKIRNSILAEYPSH